MGRRLTEPVRRRGPLAKAFGLLCAEGPAPFCGWLFRALVDPLVSTKVVYDLVRRSRDGAPVVPAKVEAEVTEVREAELPLLDTLMNQPTAVIQDRFRRGERCFVASAEGAPCGVAWVVPGPRVQVAPGLDLGSGQTYLYSVRVLPRMRGKGLATLLESAVPSLLAQEGQAEVWVRVESVNTSALRAAHKAGFEIASAVRYRRRLGRVRLERLPAPTAPRPRPRRGR